MDSNLVVVEWSPEGSRAYNPATRQSAWASTAADALSKVGAAGPVGLCLSRRVSFIRETHVPAVEKSELRLIVNVQLENLFPAVKSELAFDYSLGTHRYDDGVQTTVCATQADSLRAALRDLATAGAQAQWVAPTALGSIEVAREAGHDDAIVVEQADDALHLDIVRHGMLVYSRSAVSPATREERQAEVSRTLAAYGLPSAAVIAVGETDLGEDVRKVSTGALAAMPAHNPASVNVVLPEAIAVQLKKVSQAKSRLALILWLAVVCVGSLVYMDRDDAAKAAAKEKARIDSRLGGLSDDIDLYGSKLTSVTARSKSLDLAFDPAQPASDVLTVASNMLPPAAWLSGVTFERGKPLQIRGTAMTGDAVTAYVSALAVDTRFRDVELVFANNSEIDTVPVVQFAINAHVVGNLPLTEEKGRRGSR